MRTDSKFSRGWLVLAAATFCQLGVGQPQARAANEDKPPRSLTDKEWKALYARAEKLAAKGPEGVAALAKDIREDRAERRDVALRTLQELGPKAAPAVASIVPVLKSEDLDLRRRALATLKAIGPGARAALPALIEAAKETKDFNGSFGDRVPNNVAEAALAAVRAIDPEAMPQLAKAMIPGLLQILEKGRPGPAANALALLRRLGPYAQPALPKLKGMLATMPARTVESVLPLFLDAGETGMTLLADLVADPATTNATKIALMRGYRWEQRSTAATVRMLRVLLQDKEAEVRAAAVRTLESVRARELIPNLVVLLKDVKLLRIPSGVKDGDEYRVARRWRTRARMPCQRSPRRCRRKRLWPASRRRGLWRGWGSPPGRPPPPWRNCWRIPCRSSR